jgi:hypothetical protein
LPITLLNILCCGENEAQVVYNQGMSEQQFKIETWDELSISIKQPLLLCVAVIGLISIISTLYYFFSQPIIPLFYSLARPDQALTSKEWIFLFPAIALLITLLHSILLSLFKDLEKLVLRLFAWTTLVLLSFLLLALIRIIIITH